MSIARQFHIFQMPSGFIMKFCISIEYTIPRIYKILKDCSKLLDAEYTKDTP